MKLIKLVCYYFSLCVIVNILTIAEVSNVCAAQQNTAETVDYRVYATLLSRHVRNGFVDYDGFKNDEAMLNTHLVSMEHVDVTALSRDEQLAYYINLYNAWTIKLVLINWPGVTSIKELSTMFHSPWDLPLVRVQEEIVTLDDVEHGIIRPRFTDYRVHFALNCSAKSCPPLLAVPYAGATINAQLDAATRAFINSSDGVVVDGEGLRVSKLFEWYEDDFTPSLEDVLKVYADSKLKLALDTLKAPLAVRYMPYDWALNRQQ